MQVMLSESISSSWNSLLSQNHFESVPMEGHISLATDGLRVSSL